VFRRFDGTARMFALALLVLAGTGGGLATDLPNFSGKWKLNKNLSDDPQKKLQEAGSGSGGRGGRGGGGWGGHRSRSTQSDQGSGSDGSSGGTAARPNFEAMNHAMESLKIEHHEPELHVTDADGHESVFYTDGRKTEEERSFGGTTKIHAEWKDGHLVAVVAPERGPKTTNTYAVARDSSQLILTTRLERGRGAPPVEIRRVYDAVK